MAQETSLMAYEKVKELGKIQLHHLIIAWVLYKYGKLTAYGIAKRAWYYDNDNFGRKRKYKLDYLQVSRRMSELRNQGKVEIVGKKKDLDGATRNEYQLKK